MICKPVQLPDDIFHGLMHLPDPTPSSDGHYKPFAEIFGKETSENHQPSLQKKPKKKKEDSSIPWYVYYNMARMRT